MAIAIPVWWLQNGAMTCTFIIVTSARCKNRLVVSATGKRLQTSDKCDTTSHHVLEPGLPVRGSLSDLFLTRDTETKFRPFGSTAAR
jgi:hypothetical protein